MEESTIQSISQVIMLLFSPIALWLAWRSTKAVRLITYGRKSRHSLFLQFCITLLTILFGGS